MNIPSSGSENALALRGVWNLRVVMIMMKNERPHGRDRASLDLWESRERERGKREECSVKAFSIACKS